MSTPLTEAKAGDRYGRVVLVAFVGMRGRIGQVWRVRCDCGCLKENALAHLRVGVGLQCRACAYAQRRARGDYRRVGLMAVARRHGDRRAFELVDPFFLGELSQEDA